MIGEKITNPQRIIELAKEGKSIWVEMGSGYRSPAAVIQNWQLFLVMKCINTNCLYEYIKEDKEKVPFNEKLVQYPLTPDESFKQLGEYTDKELFKK